MDAFITVLFWLHLMGLVMGLGGGFANSQIGPRLAGASDEVRPVLWQLEHAMTRISLVGLVLLLITGPLLVWLKYGGLAAMSWAFWLKMSLLVVLLISIGLTIRSAHKAENGDLAAAQMMKRTGMTNGIVAALIVLVAVVAFG